VPVNAIMLEEDLATIDAIAIWCMYGMILYRWHDASEEVLLKLGQKILWDKTSASE
jgi:hypothetical protein